MSESIGEAIKRIRRKKGIKQIDLAENTGIAVITIRQYEAGMYEPKHDKLKKIADALGVSLSDLAPDRYPVSFDTPDDYEDAWLESGGGRHPGRKGDLAFIRYNVKRLNDDGIEKLADRSGELADEDEYKK